MALEHWVINLLLVVAAATNFVIGAIVFLRNRKAALNRSFFGIGINASGWVLTNMIFGLTAGTTQYAVALISYGFAGLLSVCFFLLCSELAKRSKDVRYYGFVGMGVLVSLLSMIPGFIATEVSSDNRVVTNHFGQAVYAICIVAFLSAGIFDLLLARKRAVRVNRAKVTVILGGLLGAALIGVAFNLFLPLNGIYDFVRIGPSGSLLFVAASAYVIIRHRLFDIRPVMARTLAYTASFLFIAIIYSVFGFGIVRLLTDIKISSGTQFLLVIFSTISVLFFQRVKSFFDRATSRLFFRDVFDPQQFLDELNKTLIGQVDVNKLLRLVTDLVEPAFRSEFCAFHIRGVRGLRRRAGRMDIGMTDTEIALLNEAFLQRDENFIIADSLDPEDRIYDILRKKDIGLVSFLPGGDGDKEYRSGFIFLGDKRSGDIYTRQEGLLLGITSKELVRAIQNALQFEEIQKFSETLQDEVDDATRKLRHSNEKLKALDETKDEFISMASHQLRTPLTSVKGYLSMVLEGDAGPLNDQQKKLLNQAFTSSQRMVYLISDLLNVSRLRTGKFVIEEQPTNLVDVIESELSQLQETAAARGLKLKFDKPADFPILNLDETKIRQVIMNFIDNAIYYTPSGGKITVGLQATPRTVEFKVTDTGLGVPKADQHKLFTKFYRAENAKRARPDGTGLGLFMAKKVIVAQGGAIIFKSTEGKGSVFGFSFPRHRLETDKSI